MFCVYSFVNWLLCECEFIQQNCYSSCRICHCRIQIFHKAYAQLTQFTTVNLDILSILFLYLNLLENKIQLIVYHCIDLYHCAYMLFLCAWMSISSCELSCISYTYLLIVIYRVKPLLDEINDINWISSLFIYPHEQPGFICLVGVFLSSQSSFLWLPTVLLLSPTCYFINMRQTSYRNFSRNKENMIVRSFNFMFTTHIMSFH